MDKKERCLILLGKQCNAACDYCFDKCNAVSPVTELHPQLISLWDEYAQVGFMGGEVLLPNYKRLMQNIISLFKNKHIYGIVTNSVFLDEEFVEYANNISMDISISWDGRHHSLHRNHSSILTSNPKLYLKINNRGVMGVTTNSNCNWLDWYEPLLEFQKRYDLSKHERIYIGKVNRCMNKSMDRFMIAPFNPNWEKYKESVRECISRLYSHCEQNGLDHIFDSIYSSQFARLIKAVFGLGDNISLDKPQSDVYDLQGNQYGCASYSPCNSKIREECQNCIYFIHCKGGCPNERVPGYCESVKYEMDTFCEIFGIKGML